MILGRPGGSSQDQGGNVSKTQNLGEQCIVIGHTFIFERELALLVALQGESIWKGGSAAGDVH